MNHPSKQSFGFWQILTSFALLALVLLTLLYGFKKPSQESLLKKADRLIQQQKTEEAIRIYLTMIDENPNHSRVPEWLLRIGDLYNFSLNQPEKAIQSYKRITLLYPTSEWAFEAYRRQAELFFVTEQFNLALKEYQSLLSNFPATHDALNYRFKLGICHLKLKQFEAARREFKRILEADIRMPLVDQVLFQTANSYFLQGNPKQAIPIYESVLEHFPKSSITIEARFNLADCYEEVGEFDQALKIYRELKENYPNPKVIDLKIQKNQERKADGDRMQQQIIEDKNKILKAKKGPVSPELSRKPGEPPTNTKPPPPKRKTYRINLDELFKEQGVE